MRSADLLGQLPDAGLNVRLQMLRPLVSRNSAQHLFQAVETLARFSCRTESLLGPLVFRREVGRHRDNLSALSNPRTCGDAGGPLTSHWQCKWRPPARREVTGAHELGRLVSGNPRCD